MITKRIRGLGLGVLGLALLGAESREAEAFGIFGCKRKVSVVPESVQVRRRIEVLTRCPEWRRRDDAAHDLREHDWRAYPEAALTLAVALRVDPHEEVREEAAESLLKLAPCLPEVHAALLAASRTERDPATRRLVSRSLEKVADRCDVECAFCGPSPTGYAVVDEAVVVEPAPSPVAVEEHILEIPTPREYPTLPEPRLPATAEPGPTILLTPPDDVPPPVHDSPFSARNARPGSRPEVVRLDRRGPAGGIVVVRTGRRR